QVLQKLARPRGRPMSGVSLNGAGLALKAALASTRHRREMAELERDDPRAGGAPAPGEQPTSGGDDPADDRPTDDRKEHGGGDQRAAGRTDRPAPDGGDHE